MGELEHKKSLWGILTHTVVVNIIEKSGIRIALSVLLAIIICFLAFDEYKDPINNKFAYDFLLSKVTPKDSTNHSNIKTAIKGTLTQSDQAISFFTAQKMPLPKELSDLRLKLQNLNNFYINAYKEKRQSQIIIYTCVTLLIIYLLNLIYHYYSERKKNHSHIQFNVDFLKEWPLSFLFHIRPSIHDIDKNNHCIIKDGQCQTLSTLIDVIGDIDHTIGQPINRLSGFYLATVEIDGVIDNVAIVRIGKSDNGNSTEYAPLIYEGIAIRKREDGDSFIAAYWKTEALCVDIFALSTKCNRDDYLILFHSTRDNVMFIDGKTAKKTSIENFGEFKITRNLLDNNSPVINGLFWDIETQSAPYETKLIKQKIASLNRIKDSIKDTNKLPALESAITDCFNQAGTINASLQIDNGRDIASNPGISDLLDSAVNTLTNNASWKTDAPHRSFFKNHGDAVNGC